MLPTTRLKVSSFLLMFFLNLSVCVAQFDQVESLDSANLTKLTNQGYQIYKIDDYKSFAYKKPKIIQPFKGFFVNGWQYTKNSLRRDNWLNIAALTGWTAMLGITWNVNGHYINVDQEIVNGAKWAFNKAGISTINNAKNISPIKGIPLWIPNNFNTSMYYLGDGITDLIIDAGFLTYGLIKKDNRALQTSAQILEGMMVVGTITQIMKHVSGRETPFRASIQGGRWRWFPNQKDYQNSVPTYDAFPSGHLCTSMLTFTVIAENYPEYKTLVWSIGGTLMTMLTTAMLVNGGGVHWASDYPVAAAIGYGFGRLVVAKNRIILKNSVPSVALQPANLKTRILENLQIRPVYNPYGGYGLGFVSRF